MPLCTDRPAAGCSSFSRRLARFTLAHRSAPYRKRFMSRAAGVAGTRFARGKRSAFPPCSTKMQTSRRLAAIAAKQWRFAFETGRSKTQWREFTSSFRQSIGGTTSSSREKRSCSSGRRIMWIDGASSGGNRAAKRSRPSNAGRWPSPGGQGPDNRNGGGKQSTRSRRFFAGSSSHRDSGVWVRRRYLHIARMIPARTNDTRL